MGTRSLSPDDEAGSCNGMGCLAAMLIGGLKEGKIGNVYVYPVPLRHPITRWNQRGALSNGKPEVTTRYKDKIKSVSAAADKVSDLLNTEPLEESKGR